MIRSYKYEVSVDTKGKPQIDGVFDGEQDALARAEYLLSLAKFTAVRVSKIDAKDNAKLIFEKAYSGGGKTVSVSEIHQAYFCKSYWDVYRFDSRHTLIRLLRKYFDEQVMIPAEVLHHYMMLRMIEREAGLFNPAIHRLAKLQATRATTKPDLRADELTRFFREITALAKESGDLAPFLGHLAEHGLSSLIDYVAGQRPPEQGHRIITFAVAKAIEEARDWGPKLAALCALFEETPSDAAVACLDEFLAELLDGSTPVRAVIGYAPDLVSALSALAALATGRLDDRLPGTPCLLQLNRQINRHVLPRTRDVLIAVITRALDGSAPLTKLGRGGDSAALRRLLPMVTEYGGFKGRGPMCGAVTRRAKTAFSGGHDDLPFESAVEKVLGLLSLPADRIGYLLDLLTTELGLRKATWLTARVGEIFAGIQSIREFLPLEETILHGGSIAEHFRPRLFAGGIPQDLAIRFMERLELLAHADERARLAAPPKPARRPGRLPDPASEIAEAATIDFSPVVPENALDRPHLILTYQGEDHVLDHSVPVFVIGRNPDCDMIVRFAGASRAHAKIHRDDDRYFLVDHSKNGTYVQMDDQPSVVLKGTSFALDGSGMIFPGADPTIDLAGQSHAIGFRYVGNR
ncbi:MAG: FHA domain-containing protein [Azospirillum sp.]|nr:FHA domain-containing protein [Azospirillum sp.]